MLLQVDELPPRRPASARSASRELIAILKIHPALRIGAEEPCEAQRGGAVMPRPSAHDFVDSRRCHTESLRKRGGGQSERLHEVVLQNLSGVNRLQSSHGPMPPSVIIDDLRIVSVAVGKWKQRRHWALIRMLYEPSRSPASDSSRYPEALSGNRASWRHPVGRSCAGLPSRTRRNVVPGNLRRARSVALQRKLRIMTRSISYIDTRKQDECKRREAVLPAAGHLPAGAAKARPESYAGTTRGRMGQSGGAARTTSSVASSTRSPGAKRTSSTVPSAGAVRVCSIFIASRTSTA